MIGRHIISLPSEYKLIDSLKHQDALCCPCDADISVGNSLNKRQLLSDTIFAIGRLSDLILHRQGITDSWINR